MQQLSLFDNSFALAGILPAVKACMRRIIGEDECRKSFVDKLNAVPAAFSLIYGVVCLKWKPRYQKAISGAGIKTA